MASETNYSNEYGQAEKAYLQGNFNQAAEIIDRLAEDFPEDPHVLLLRGHIYCYGFQNYDLAQQQYELASELSQDQEILDYAYHGIEQVKQLQQQASSEQNFEQFDVEEGAFSQDFELAENWNETSFTPDLDSDHNDFEHENNYGFQLDDLELEDLSEVNQNAESYLEKESTFTNPFGVEEKENWDSFNEIEPASAFSKQNTFDQNYSENDPFAQFEPEEVEQDLSAQVESSYEFEDFEASEAKFDESNANASRNNVKTFMVDEEDENESLYGSGSHAPEDTNFLGDTNFIGDENYSSDLDVDTILTESYSDRYKRNLNDHAEEDESDYQDELEFDEIDSSFFDLEELEQGLPDTGLFNVADNAGHSSHLSPNNDVFQENRLIGIEENEASQISQISHVADIVIEPSVETRQGLLAGFVNAPIQKKQLITASVTGVVSLFAVLTIGLVGTAINKEDNTASGARNSALMALVAGVASFGTAIFFGNLTAKQIEQATKDLENQFDDVYQGNLNAKATVYSRDEFGMLATRFNRMTKVILTTTQEAQRRAEETEQAKEDLQRQVIRLLDDVEGAARGDLTVQATVTADVLGAVADAFNLTIQSLREIVRQVKQAAEQVNKGSTDSELFARNQSSEALRMAEELAVTLNSVQMMTESIERVAENAREAEEVARSSSVTALKGGKAVDRTVAGIFQIRETVSETARKVKRLAEASQEISKIVLLISTIAERTNQLALNASIQAAKAGEAGRGFAVVADEVRQLADRSAKSLKEIEQIVLQIQSETGSVMTAMEEGIQEVIDVTDRAEQAKTALEDIIQVSNRIDTLVRSITADTVEQRENSRAVAQVMQSVELTAQATSQESQRVAGALQNLVSIARDLLSSVERFRIDKNED
ncbi:methyl-accepting chemotaxis sensory transducer [Stanieria cyanosphaera PCC 7437]|uniref:Methyl-accepting chemotaxis sensory transducer n=1 Tax=Stanieria cyanosphaera (strain ATCC 29371 / PCC 7437) TaxID=111780 RepID=K9XX01_STAC7|nr:methyl-accepting chemotaxis protein [Stanieria cyanosphaera]AFZ37053.1 methyl-accepting chemotaxis sensory transducer [Stanieria cyanosphaera PCC 7437]